MTKLRATCRIAALFLLLFAIVVIPERALAGRAAASLGELFTHHVAAWELNSGSYEQMDISEKIALLNNADTLVQWSDMYELSSGDRLLEGLQEQLELLHSHNALPPFSAEPLQAYATQKRYTRAADPQQAVTVWLLYVEYKTCTLCAHLDADTFAVYDICFTSSPGYAFDYPPIANADGYRSYIGSFFAAEPPQLSFHYGYEMEEIYISLIMGNDAEEQHSSCTYTFSGDMAATPR
ncbi:MAG: hypothetical protein IKM70_04010 [Firmicutes bacterium]|nr:hypothetical protein [Bacillota bacterium]